MFISKVKVFIGITIVLWRKSYNQEHNPTLNGTINNPWNGMIAKNVSKKLHNLISFSISFIENDSQLIYIFPIKSLFNISFFSFFFFLFSWHFSLLTFFYVFHITWHFNLSIFFFLFLFSILWWHFFHTFFYYYSSCSLSLWFFLCYSFFMFVVTLWMMSFFYMFKRIEFNTW